MKITNGATDEILEDDLAAGAIEKGVWKVYNERLYNQDKVDAYSCTVVATYTAVSNMLNIELPVYLMKTTLSKMIKARVFTPKVGAKLSDGVAYSLRDINFFLKKNIKSHSIILNAPSIIKALKLGSPVVTGIYYGKGYFTDEQDNAWVDNYLAGSGGHAISICKINTYDDILLKYCENYLGKIVNNVIGMNFDRAKKNNLLFNSGFYFTLS